MTAYRNIALTGKMGSGKSTIADVLMNTYGYRTLSFASPLKGLVIEADPLVMYESLHGTVTPVPIHLSDVLASGKTFEEAKRKYPEVRRSLQRIGQGIRRIDPDYWVRNLMERVLDVPSGTPIVVPDVRYPNELEALAKNGFKTVRVQRKYPQGLTNDESRAMLHESETALDTYNVDALIKNDGEMIDLISKALDVIH
jgi:hypothetical protein